MRVVNRVCAAVLLLAVAALLAPWSVRAQGSPTGILTGTVSDPSGAVLPGVTVVARGSTSLFFNGVDATNLTSNEGSLNDNVSLASDTLEEVKLQTSLYDASTGRSGGGNFQLVTRSGTNVFKGPATSTFSMRS
jgi:hypothetical protein